MKTAKEMVEFVLFLLFKYYEEGKGTRTIAYTSALTAFLALLFVNLVTIFRLFGLGFPLSLGHSDPRWLVYLKSALWFVLPGYLILNIFFPKRRIKNLSYDGLIVDKGNNILLACCIISFVMMILVIMLKDS